MSKRTVAELRKDLEEFECDIYGHDDSYAFSHEWAKGERKRFLLLIAELLTAHRREVLEEAAKAVRATCGYVRGPGANGGCEAKCLCERWESCRAKPIHELLREGGGDE